MLRPDGTIHLPVDPKGEKIIACRNPTVGEYEKLYELLMSKPGDRPEEPPEELVARHHWRVTCWGLYEWLEAVCATLGDSALPPKEECAMWVTTDSNIIGEIMEHWQTVPLVSSPQNAKPVRPAR